MLDKTILHIGLDKTGSTAIQLVCQANKNVLLEHSIIYPLAEWEKEISLEDSSTYSWIDSTHGQLGSYFYDDPNQYIYNIEFGQKDANMTRLKDEQYLQALRDELSASEAQIMVLSSEAFVYMEPESIQKMSRFLASISRETQVILYYRDPLSYAVSAISQRVRTGRTMWPEPLIQPVKDICEKFMLAFGDKNVIVRKFSRDDFIGNDVRFDFLSFIGISFIEAQQSFQFSMESDNKSLSYEAALIADAIRKSYIGTSFSDVDFSIKYENILRKIGGNSIQLTKEQFDSVILATKEHVDYVAEHYGITFERSLRYKENTDPMFSSEVIESIAKVIIELTESSTASITENKNTYIGINTCSSDIVVGKIRLRDGADLEYGQITSFEIDILLKRPISNFELGIHIYDADKRWAFGTNTRLLGHTYKDVQPGAHRVIYHLLVDLPIGTYTAGFAFTERLNTGETQLAWFDALCEFNVTRHLDQLFAGYSYLSTEISLLPIVSGSEFSDKNPIH